MNYWLMIKKGILGALTGLAASVVSAIAMGIMNYQPIACSETVIDKCLPQFVVNLYSNSLVPLMTGALVALANWLKNRDK